MALGIVFFQRHTGPTHPIKSQEVWGKVGIDYKFLRSHDAMESLPVRLEISDLTIPAFVEYRRYKTPDDWTRVSMNEEKGGLVAKIPGQPAAGKVEYKVLILINQQMHYLNQGEPIVARFKNKVPGLLILFHVMGMFLGMIFSFRTGLECLRKKPDYFKLVNLTILIVFIGGLILGPIVQKIAFGDLWTGFPFGTDLTDNKTLIAFLLWVVAAIFKKNSKWWVIAAVILMTVVYLIPHSLFGSELDYQKGTMKNKWSQLNSVGMNFGSPLLSGLPGNDPFLDQQFDLFVDSFGKSKKMGNRQIYV